MTGPTKTKPTSPIRARPTRPTHGPTSSEKSLGAGSESRSAKAQDDVAQCVPTPVSW